MTEPAPARARGPLIPGPVETVVSLWRWLRRMRTALHLLAALGAATLLATVVPQRPNVADTVAQWLDGTAGPGQLPARLLDAVGAYDVFGAPWFLVLLALLFTSLTSCLIPRYRAYWRLVRRGRPPRSRNLARQPHVATIDTDQSAAEALAAVRDVLIRRRFRLRADDAPPDAVVPTRSDARVGVAPAPADLADSRAGAHAGVERAAVGAPGADLANAARPQVAAERGHLSREGGSLVFHTAFYLLLIGVVVGKLTTFTGQVGIVEGEPGFTDTSVAYWVKDAGRWWGADDHAGFQLDLDRFDVDWTGAAQPVLFRSDVRIRHADGRTQQRTTVINDPLVVDGMKVHMLDWGYAARVIVRDGDDVAHDGWIHMTAVGGGVWRGAVKAPGVQPQIGLELHLFPDAPEGPDGRPVPTGWPGARAPLLLYTVWAGDLRFDRVQGVNDLDTTAMRELTHGGLRPGFQAELPTGATVAFADLRRWVGFQVSRRPTDPLLLAAAALLLVGLIPALYAYRRRVWVEAAEIDGSTRIIVAGHALQRPQAFEEEFPTIVAALRRRLEPDRAGRSGRDPDPDASREVVSP